MSVLPKTITETAERPYEHQLRFFPPVAKSAETHSDFKDQMLYHLACHEAEIAAYIEEERRRKLQAKIQESLRGGDSSSSLGNSNKKPTGTETNHSESSLKPPPQPQQKTKKRPMPTVVETASPASAIGERSSKLGFGIKKIKSDKPRPMSSDVFKVDAPAPRPLKTLDDDDDDPAPAAPPQVRKASLKSDIREQAEDATSEEELRRIAERIPTDRDALFAMSVDWATVRFTFFVVTLAAGGKEGHRPTEASTLGCEEDDGVPRGRGADPY